MNLGLFYFWPVFFLVGSIILCTAAIREWALPWVWIGVILIGIAFYGLWLTATTEIVVG